MTVENYADDKKIDEDIRIDNANLSACFADQASTFVHYARLRAKAEKQAAVKELLLKAESAKLDKEIRTRAAKEGTKTTETAILNEIALTPSYLKAKMEQIEADAVNTGMKLIITAFEQRKDMLIQLGADNRKEMDGALRMSVASPSISPTNAIEAYKNKHLTT